MNNVQVMKVQGEGSAAAQPDLLVIKLDIVNKDRKYAAAVAGLNQKTEQLRLAIESCGLKREDLKSFRFSVESDYLKDGNRNNIFDGYVAAHAVNITLPFDQKLANAVFRALVECGTATDFTVAFDVKDREALRQRAIEAAVQNAKSRAELLAKGAGVKLGTIQSIEYGFSEVHISSGLQYQMADMTADCAGPDLEAADMSATDRVTITWEFAD